MSKLAEVLQHVSGPFPLAGLALLIVGALMLRVLTLRQTDRSRRVFALAILCFGAAVFAGGLYVAVQGVESARGGEAALPAAPSQSVRATASGPRSIAISAGRDVRVPVSSLEPEQKGD